MTVAGSEQGLDNAGAEPHRAGDGGHSEPDCQVWQHTYNLDNIYANRDVLCWQCPRNGLIYFPDFCQLVLENFRQSEEEEEDFYKNAFKVHNLYNIYKCIKADIVVTTSSDVCRYFAAQNPSRQISALRSTNWTSTSSPEKISTTSWGVCPSQCRRKK